MHAIRATVVPLVIGILIAGCMGGGDLKAETAVLTYEGNQSGDHEDKADCDRDGQLNGNGKVEDGQVKVIVKDGQGREIFSRTYDGEFDLDSSSLTGDPGNWTVRAERGGDDVVGDEFNGRYSFSMIC